ncbi:CDP-alcohol phosphatidyltransferase family protein [Gimesia panareensis]|uniref:CDP-alcohol phosphatidyltransferase family protein n=1 Tax=Gimesia panareensis TaxID=2527978 RepID=UPI001188CC32|nr:CDP-alcohol phosphatidyltransferase family protein [Gimesia panareensis]QDU49369.1 CDP-diacylglycerol--inositol 3-phosphatidyltransferase [Gimesia panareensis]
MCCQKNATKSGVSVYASGEQSMMDASQQRRHQLLLPVLKLFVRCGITPNLLTGLSLICGIGFCFTFGQTWEGARLVSFGLLLLHVLLDGIDGPLARFQGTAGNRGSFTDTTSDQLVVAFTTITLIHYQTVNVVSGGLYLLFYTVVVVFAMIRSSLAIPYSWLVRPRFFVYAWIPIDVYFLPGTLNYLLWLCVLPLAWKSITGFYKIQKQL